MSLPTTAITEREAWLNAMRPFINAHFKAVGFDVPPLIRFSCGWPSKGGLGNKKRVIGQVWDDTCTTDKHFLIFISPTLDDPIRVVGVQIHEVVHAVVGLAAKHKKPFSSCAAMVGLTPKWTATGESEALKATIAEWVKAVGPYPHGALNPGMGLDKPEKGRMLLLECECGLKIRTTQKWLDAYGPEWACPCGQTLVYTEIEGKD